ncbi:hypothetical protein [Capnocytophaga sputigena]|mgnify:CR=1 FL=1|uniref:hypothetical protein n=1 Tax=Capnocytophaga sputigena TaxID=1019 RepID=UPI00248DEEA1|nr:hypothetical protein [Capnocytophaga sputigena]
MKKLLNRWFCYTLVLLCSAMYAQPCTFEDVVKKTTYDIPYEKYNANLDMLAVLNYKKTDFYGFIGVNRKRLRITFTSIKKSEENKDVYEVEGFSTVMNKNKRTFKGTFTLLSHYRLTAPAFDEDEPLKKGEAEGFSTFSYTLKEDENLTATGIFKGEMLVLWYKGINKKPVYTELFIQSDGSRNYQFFGTWTSYKTKKTSIASWGEYRIPCSGDFDGGDGTFYPTPKYWQYGWEEFRY